ncbi:YbbC/YhhH family protein [Myroides sp. M-43]|uniref:YbbC/YhhH family protein n=1 Tax=Myroides oncorhynchi TaxID=2893756 RepID=UPI001E299AA2|nr:YbbC/YhhH family protein [Myroides oncorhynchi]MCC9043947.1 YbbC/YhhH family protein [Myroides oncorhynchi]
MKKILYMLVLGGLMSCHKEKETVLKEDIQFLKIENGLIESTYYETVENIPPIDGFIPNDSTAVRIAETMLYKVYGENNIVRQRPYNIALKQDSIWCIQGNLPEGWEGGVFYIELNKNNGKVEKMFHDK